MKKLFLSLALLLPMMIMAQSKKVSSVVVAESNYVVRGGTYKAKLVPVSEELTSKARFFVNGKEIPNGKYSKAATTVGNHRQKGYMLLGNDTTHYPFTFSYLVGEPSFTMSNVELNIMYRNYENKFNISVPGFSNDKIVVSAKGAAVKKNKFGIWGITPSDSVNSVTVFVSVDQNGKQMPIGSNVYRVKSLPLPSAYLSCSGREYGHGSNISMNTLTAEGNRLIVSYGPDGLLNLPFKVTQFTVTVSGQMIQCAGGILSKPARDSISRLKAGSTVIFSDIKAESAEGKVVRLSPICLTVN